MSPARLLFCLLLGTALGWAQAQDGPADATLPAEAPSGQVLHSLRFGVGAGNELNSRFWVRALAEIGIPASAGAVRLSVDYGRQSALSRGTLTVMAHVLFLTPEAELTSYLGLGAGIQTNPAAWPQANDGFLIGFLAGARYQLTRGVEVFVETGLDLYPSPPPATGDAFQYDSLYPSLAVGAVFRPFAPP